MVSLRRLKHKAVLIGCNVKKVDSCKSKTEVEKLMKVIDDHVKEDLKMSDKEKEKEKEEDSEDENGSSE